MVLDRWKVSWVSVYGVRLLQYVPRFQGASLLETQMGIKYPDFSPGERDGMSGVHGMLSHSWECMASTREGILVFSNPSG